MIEVKATKAQSGETDPAARFKLKETEERSKLPYVFALFITGIAAYLKAIFPGKAAGSTASAAAEQPQSAPAEDDEESQLALVGLTPTPTSGETPESDLPQEEARVGSGGTLFGELEPLDRIPLIEMPHYDCFVNDELEFDWGRGFLMLPRPRVAANDNGGALPDISVPVMPDPDDETPDDEDTSTDEDEDDEDDEDPEAANRAPRISGAVTLADISGCAILAIGFADLLANAVDPDGDELVVENISVSAGDLTESAWGWTFDPEQHFGPVTITYEVSDGEFSVAQTAHFLVVRKAIAGSEADDLLLGSMCGDDIDGRGGNDNIDARAGDDVVSGGAEDDHIVAGDGDDVVLAGRGDDIVFGGAGDDHVDGGTGDDRLFGDAGDDVIYGGEGEDQISGGDGDDVLIGDAGDDVIQDGAGADVVEGGEGSDTTIAALDAADDLYDGQEGTDTLDYSAAIEDVTIDIGAGTASGAEIGEDVFKEFETFSGGQGDDHLAAAEEAVVLSGGGGDDLFEFCEPPASAPITLHEILDFDVGDRVRMSRYDLFERTFDELEDRFEDIYGDGIDDNDVAIRYRHESVDDFRSTIIEADFDRDDIYETMIQLQGHRVMVAIEHGIGAGEWA